MIVITGATGTVGRPLVERLSAAGAPVRAITRSPEVSGLPADVETVVGDPSRPDTIASALHGAAALFLHPRAVGDAAFDLAALARERGVGRIVALSAINVDDPLATQPSRLRGDRNLEAEQAAVGSGLEWTSLRASAFAGNTIGMWSGQIKAGNTVRFVYGDFAESVIHEHDIADVAAHALLTDDLVDRRVDLTGPESLTHRQLVATIGEVIGRPLQFVEIMPEHAAAGMRARGFSEIFVAALMARYAGHAGTPHFPPTDDVEKALGRPARGYAEWVADHAAAFTAVSSASTERTTHGQ